MLLSVTVPSGAQPIETQPLRLETKILLGDVRGRIDHMAIDPIRNRLFVAELGNNSVGIVDLAAGKVIHRIAEQTEPQGVAYEPSTDALYVANGGDGSVRMFRGADFSEIGRIELGDDADNIRIDSGANRVLVGYGTAPSPRSTPRKDARSRIFPCRHTRKDFSSTATPTGYSSTSRRRQRSS